MRRSVISNGECNQPRNKMSRSSRILLWTLLSMLTLIWVTRLLALKHGMVLHPDEWVFFSSASSLFKGSSYQVYKTYPEGAFLMQMPFQMARQFALQLIQFGDDVQKSGAHLMGRISSVVYFSLGAVLGCTFLHLTQKKTMPVVLFAIAMVFSLFQIEQSRYGTGEAPSFFLVMAILNLLALYLRRNRFSLLCIAAVLTGILGAVKYPQLYFILLPLCTTFLNRRSSKISLLVAIPAVLGCCFLGFVCFSPSLLQREFLTGIISREMDAYVANPNLWTVGTPLGHLVSLQIYHLLYADVPLAPILALFGIVPLFRQHEKDGTASFLRVIPFIFLGFFMYNLFVPTLFFRTYYIYFCVCLLYTCIGVSTLLERKGWKPLMLVLLCVMVLRGVFLIGLLSQPQKDASEPLRSNPNWSDRVVVTVLGKAYLYGEISGDLTQIDMLDAFLIQTPALKSHEFCVTGPYQFGLARTMRFLIRDADVQRLTDGWDSFRDQNSSFLFEKLYPDAYYALFGYWLEGSTGTPYEFPSAYFYFKP